MSDIHDRRDNYINELEEKLESQTYFFENLLARLPGHVYWLDKNNVYLGCNNQQATDGNLKSRHDIRGKKNCDLPWSEQAEALDEANEYVLRTGKSLKKIEYSLLNNEVKSYLSDKIPLHDQNGNICGVLGVSMDITELVETKKALTKAKEQAEAANEAKSKFIANMSHDIRTPLTGIVGLSDILFDSVESKENKEYAQMLNLSGEQLLSLLNSVLEVVASESGNFDQVETTSFNIHELLHNVFELEMPALKLKGLRLTLDLADDTPLMIKTDKGKLYRILLNLLSNSIKFTETGGVSISVWADKQIDDGSEQLLHFRIKDTGIGIPQTDTNKIFNAFFRSHPSYEGKYDGFGVGLHLVKQYVDLLQGDVSVESFPGEGACFDLSIPVLAVVNDKTAKDANLSQHVNALLDDINAPSIQEKGSLETRSETTKDKAATHVLLVEDNPMAMKVADTILANTGATTDKAYTAAEAFDLFKQHHYDFVLTDIGLPDYSGFQLTDEMRAFEKEHKPDKTKTPIIGLTAHAKQEALLQGRQSGMLEVCEKPLTAKTARAYVDLFGQNSRGGTAARTSSDNEKAELPLLDVELGISQLVTLDDLKEMLELMVNDSIKNTVPTIKSQYQNQDWVEFEKSVHKFKSSCLYCATTRLLNWVQQLEKAAKTHDLHQIKPVYNSFCQCVTDTEKHIVDWLETH